MDDRFHSISAEPIYPGYAGLVREENAFLRKPI
jgi:hypothetical protein